MSQNKNIEEFINALVISFITTTIVIVGRDVIKILNDKIEKLNEEVIKLNNIIQQVNLKNNCYLKEIEASYNTKLEDFQVKYNADILAINANIEGRSNSVSRQQDEIIKNAVNNQDETIKTMLDSVDELNGQMSAVQFNISSIMGHRNEYNNFINNELVAIRGKIDELELEMPVFIGCKISDDHDIFVDPKYTESLTRFGYFKLNLDCLKRLKINSIDMSRVPSYIINGINKEERELSSDDKAYIKRRCEEYGIRIDNASF